MNTKDTEPLDATTLAQFTGTAQYWRVARQFAITDGVKYLAETAACFWLIDAAISHLLEISTADWFVLVWQVLLAPALAGYAAFNQGVNLFIGFSQVHQHLACRCAVFFSWF